MQKLKYLIEAAGLLTLLFAAFRLLPLDVASAIGGFMARTIGPFLSAHKTAVKNLSMVFPDMPEAEKRKMLRDMWDNLGRNAAELPHLPGEKFFSRMNISGLENLPPGGKAGDFFLRPFRQLGIDLSHRCTGQGVPLTLIYRQRQ